MKFEVGEVAVLAVNLMRTTTMEIAVPKGAEVTIKAIGHRGYDYQLESEDGIDKVCDECDLRKRRPPEEPAEDEFQQELKLWLSPAKRLDNA